MSGKNPSHVNVVSGFTESTRFVSRTPSSKKARPATTRLSKITFTGDSLLSSESTHTRDILARDFPVDRRRSFGHMLHKVHVSTVGRAGAVLREEHAPTDLHETANAYQKEGCGSPTEATGTRPDAEVGQRRQPRKSTLPVRLSVLRGSRTWTLWDGRACRTSDDCARLRSRSRRNQINVGLCVRRSAVGHTLTSVG